MPRFSIVVPTYRGSAHIAECLASVLGQDFSDLEVIVVDDKSPDGTAGVVRSIAEKDARVRLLERAENGGTLRCFLTMTTSWPPVRLRRLTLRCARLTPTSSTLACRSSRRTTRLLVRQRA